MTRRRDPEFERERRKQRRLAQAGTREWRCLGCGNRRSTAINIHHRAGKIKGEPLHEFTWPFSGDCHDEISDMQRDLGKPGSNPPSLLNRAGRFLVGRSQELMLISHYIEQTIGYWPLGERAENTGIDDTYLRELVRYQSADADACRELGLQLIAADGKQSGRRTPHKK